MNGDLEGGIKLLVAEARFAVEEKNWALAAFLWCECIEKFGTGEQPWWDSNYARALIELKRYDEANKALQKLVLDHPGFPPAYANQATLSYRQGALEQSAERWHTCLGLFEEDIQPGWYSSYAYVLIELQRYEDASIILEKLKKLQPNFLALHVCQANLASSQKDWQLALDRWVECIRLFDDGTKPEWHINHANSLFELNRCDEAEAILLQLVNDQPDFLSAYASLGTSAMRQQRWENAVGYWKKCIRLNNSENCGWNKNLACALLQMERFQEAKKVFIKIESSLSDDSAVLEGLARTSYLTNDLQKCMHYAEKLKAIFPEMQSGYSWSEKVLIKQGRFSEAADAHLAWKGISSTADESTLLPDNYPVELTLPPILGNGNDYSFIEDLLADFEENGRTYTLPVSIIVPVYNRASILSKTLASLMHQTYPAKLIEVVVADDGSTDNIKKVINKYSQLLNLKYVRQQDLGYRAAAVRNLGIRAASFEHMVFLDCDMMPLPGLVEAYMKFFHVSNKAVLFGLRRYVCTKAYTDEEIIADLEIIQNLPDIDPADTSSTWKSDDGKYYDYRLPLLISTNNFKEEIFPCRAFLGGNMALSRVAIESAGFFDESFQAWGGEDDEFGYRIWNEGYYVIPVNNALALHQEPSDVKNDFQVDRSKGREKTRPILEQKCPTPYIRKYQQGITYEVPKVSIYIPAYNVEEYLKDAVDSALAQTYTDLEVVICNDGSTDGTIGVLEENYTNNHRVRWITQSNQGIASATNAAIKACKGMYIGQLDADDMLHPQAVETFVSHLDSNNDGVAYGFYTKMDHQGKMIQVNHSVPFLREKLLVGMICSHFRMFRKREWLRTAGCDLSLKNAVDYDLMLKFSEICSIRYIPQLSYYYRIHGANTSFSERLLQERNHVLVINKALSRMRLSSKWLAVSGPPDNRRHVRFINQDQ